MLEWATQHVDSQIFLSTVRYQLGAFTALAFHRSGIHLTCISRSILNMTQALHKAADSTGVNSAGLHFIRVGFWEKLPLRPSWTCELREVCRRTRLALFDLICVDLYRFRTGNELGLFSTP